jgi:3-phosphoshikimate 1-carboxyvinyltransferase
MKRVAAPLEQMGARVSGTQAGDLYPPITVSGGGLVGIRHVSRVASAQVKSAVLIAGMYARGTTEVHEPGPSRDHTERMLARLGAPLTVPGPRQVQMAPDGWDRRLAAQPLSVPGDPSSSAFLLAAALVAGTVGLTIEGVCVNPTRTGFLDALALMGAEVRQENARERCGEPVADLVLAAGASPSRGCELAGDLVVRAIDELPILAVVASRAPGTTVIRDAHELRVKESDRVATTVAMLRAFGVPCDERPDGLVVHGDAARVLHAGEVHAHGDHRIAMSGAILALAAPPGSVIHDVANVATSFPAFVALMARLGAKIDA